MVSLRVCRLLLVVALSLVCGGAASLAGATSSAAHTSPAAVLGSAGPTVGKLRLRTEPGVVGGASEVCVLDGAGQGLTSLSVEDVTPFVGVRCTDGGGVPFGPATVVDLSHNALTTGSLAPGVFDALNGGLEFDLSFNAFASDSLQGLFNSSAPGGCALCGLNIDSIDLSYNPIGPIFPPELRLIKGNPLQEPATVLLISCGITDVPAESMLGANIGSLDLSLNNLRNGLHAFSFAGTLDTHGTSQFALSCAYCNLRSHSLPVGVFDMARDMSGWLNLANDFLFPASNFLPRTYVNDSRIFTKDRFTPPNATTYVHRLPTPKEYLASWSNCFVDLPAAVLTRSAGGNSSIGPSGANYTQPVWFELAIGDLVSVSGAVLGAASAAGGLTLDLAPQAAAVALGLELDSFCPLYMVAHSMVLPAPLIKAILEIRAYDQPIWFSSSSCAFPELVSPALSLVPSLAVPIEPAFLWRWLGRWLNGVGFVKKQLSYTAPKYALWHQRLRTSDWAPSNLLCDLQLKSVVMPALPWSDDPAQANFPFPPPDDMLSCLGAKMFEAITIDWSAAGVFGSGMLSGLASNFQGVLILNVQRLYAGAVPVPTGFFDPVAEANAAVTFEPPCDKAAPTPACLRIRTQCVAWRNGQCVPCEAGGTASSLASDIKTILYYCSACPVGHWCEANLSPSPLPCSPGTFQPLTAQSTCKRCQVGTYSEYSGRTDPSACIQCPPGRFNPVSGGTTSLACEPCPVGTASGVPGVSGCPQCPPGQYQNSTGQIQCSLCPEDHYLPSYGGTNVKECKQCPDATPQSVAGSSSILQCTVASTWCKPGQFFMTSINACTYCPRGYSCMNGALTQCKPGSYTDKDEQSSCKPCGLGHFGTVTGSTTSDDCTPCQFSAFSDYVESSACRLCPVGTASTVLGAYGRDVCQIVPGCLDARSIVTNITDASTHRYCALGATVPVDLSHLAVDGVETLAEFMALVTRLSNFSSNDPPSAKLINAMAAWPPLKLAPSLRMAAFETDPVLTVFEATGAAFSNTSTALVSDPTRSALSDASLYALLATLLCVAFLPWLAYRWVPARVVVHADQFRMAHRTRIGESPVSSPTQLGAAFTWSFLWVAVLVAILLGSESNTLSTTELVPPSAAEYSGTARANFQITLRAYTGDSPAEMAKWCATGAGSTLIADQTGLTNSWTLRTAVPSADRQSCDIALDCLDCGMDSSAYVSFLLRFNAQVIEWELWINSAQADSWSRAYGVRAAPPGALQPAQSTITFTTIESYFIDARSGAAVASVLASGSPTTRSRRVSRSGFEFSFVDATTITLQPVTTFNTASTVGLTFAFKKSDVLLRTQLTNKQTVLQILAVIASTVVSLFALFGLVFRLLEAHVFSRCGWSSGPIVRDEAGATRLLTDSYKASLSAPLLMDADFAEQQPRDTELSITAQQQL